MTIAKLRNKIINFKYIVLFRILMVLMIIPFVEANSLPIKTPTKFVDLEFMQNPYENLEREITDEEHLRSNRFESCSLACAALENFIPAWESYRQVHSTSDKDIEQLLLGASYIDDGRFDPNKGEHLAFKLAVDMSKKYTEANKDSSVAPFWTQCMKIPYSKF